MPRFVTSNDDGERVERYRWPARHITPSRQIWDALRRWRSEGARDREELLGFQKQNSGDRQAARFFKQEAAHHLKLQRACTLMLPWFGQPDTSQTVERPILWPLDLESEMDEISGRIELLT